MPKAKPQPNRPPGRPKAVIDWDRVGKMCEAGASGVGIAATLGIDEGTLRKRSETDHNCSFSEFSRQKKAKGDELLRVAQFNTAMKGNVTMQIWLGKQRLNQSDKMESKIEVTDLKSVAKIVADFRERIKRDADIYAETNGKYGYAMPDDSFVESEITKLLKLHKVSREQIEKIPELGRVD